MDDFITDKINALLGIAESYKAPQRIMKIIESDEKRNDIFSNFLEEFNYNVSYDWFGDYFEAEHADRKEKKQDFSPIEVSRLISKIITGEKKHHGLIYEPCAGTGQNIISCWHSETRKYTFPWDYNANNYLYVCEELSDRATPFLLFNLLIRGINAVVIHGDVLSRCAKDVYLCINENGDYNSFSELVKLPQNKNVEFMFSVKFDQLR